MATRMKKIDVETEITETEETPKKKKPSDWIMCHSVTAGGLNIVCKSGNYYEFKAYGDDCEIEYRDLVDLARRRSDHIYNPRIVIDDEDFLAEFPQIRKVYDELYSINDLLSIVDLPDAQMEATIKTLPSNVAETLKSLIAEEIASGRIDSVRKIRTLSSVFNSDFDLLSQLFIK